jgi:nucleotide-binding universal stress UspA family protein
MMNMYRNILVATDLLPASFPALRDGLCFARSQEAAVAVIYVMEIWMVERQWFARVSEEDIAFHRAFLAREEEAVAGELRAQIDRARSEQQLEIAVDTLVRQGRAPDEIAAAASRRGCDLIVIGTRGRPDTLGSVAEQVVRIARRPVLVVPAEPPR